MSEANEDIVCKSLRVVDEEGRASILLSTSDGSPCVTLVAPGGEFVLAISVSDRAAHLGLERGGYPRIDIQVDLDGAFLSMSGADRHPLVAIGGSGPSIVLYKNGRHLVEISANENGVPSLRLWNGGVLVHSVPIDGG